MPKEIAAKLDATGKSFSIVISRYNHFLTGKMLEGALDCLTRHGAEDSKIEIVWVPGSFEIPYIAKRLAASGKYNAVVCLGAVIRGDTPHFDYIASEVAKGIAKMSLDEKTPVIFGVITSDTLEQAIERAGTKSGNKGWDAALCAIELANLYELV